MKTRRSTRLMAGVAAVALGFAALGGTAQAALSAPPVRATIDPNGVDLLTGGMTLSTQEVTVGNPTAGGLAFGRNRNVGDLAAWRNNLTGTLNSNGGVYTVSFGGASESFTLAGGVYTSDQAAGSTLTFNSGTNKYTYTSAAGVVVTFDKTKASTNYVYYLQDANEGLITQVAYPNGEVDTYTYVTASVSSTTGIRLQSVTNNLGYHLKLEYANATPASAGDFPNWLKLSKVTGLNGAVDYCSPTANSCTGSITWPSATYGVPGDNALAQTVTDTLGRVTRYTYNSSGYLTGIRRPSAGSDTTTVTYDGNNRVASVSNGTGTWTYGYAISGDTLTTTVTDPLSHTRVVTSYISLGVVTGDTDGAGHTTTYSYDDDNRLASITYPEGNSVNYTYDSRGNVTGTAFYPKSGSGLTPITTSASFDSTCSNAVKCNKPNSTTDALGKVTDYTYDTTTGALTSVTRPAPTIGAVRPQTRYSYTSLSAYYKDYTGSIAAAPSQVSMLTGVSECATGSTSSPTCVGTSDEVKTTIAYGTTGVANNLLPTSVSKGAGDGSLTATTAFTYDGVGNILTVDGPLSGTGDTTRYRYDDDRELVGVVGPDPDGAGSLKNRATRYTYNSDGQVTLVEAGKVDSQSNSDWSGFTLIEKQTATYDTRGLKTKTTAVNAGGTTLAVVQYSYDNANRLDCTALRMNSAVFASPPSSACTLGTTGSDGPDRITKNTYDSADRITKVTEGYASGAPRDTVTVTYSNNGQEATVADALGGLTTYEYDGFDRLLKIRYPDKTTRTSSSTTDYEGYTYDAGSRVTADRRRDGSSFGFTYDNLGRMTLRDAPAGQDDVTTTYDNLGRPASTYYAGHTLTFGYDALSRMTSAAGPLGTVAYQYDLAGKRTQMTWPDTSFYVNYDYDATGAVTKIREKGATSGAGVLAAYAYDDLGRRTTLTRGNGVVTTYSFDDLSNLTSLAQNLTGTADDLTYSLTYNAAGEALTRSGSSSNTGYVPATPYNGSRSYSSNGLNQYTAADLTYDNRGNLTGEGGVSYSYDGQNRLTTAGSATLTYDPAGRLFQTAGSSTTKFLYDGEDLIAEYNSSGTMLRRYVHGPGLDEPLVWYEGSGTSDRRWLVADQLGSTVATTDGTGAATAVNNYDENGKPGPSNTGTFQYTGQRWVPDANLFHFKARVYSPYSGRFLQPDPIGYGGGYNLYAYAGNNPVNFLDPSGTTYVTDTRLVCTEIQGFGKSCSIVYDTYTVPDSWNGMASEDLLGDGIIGPGSYDVATNGYVWAKRPGATCTGYDPKARPILPKGYKMVDVGGGRTNVYMRGPDNKLYPTPDNVERSKGFWPHFNWGGAAADFGSVSVGGLGAIGGVPGAVASGVGPGIEAEKTLVAPSSGQACNDRTMY